ncbi:MAG: hypothetical protein WC426_02640 [Sulfuriferula sp.]
MASIWGEAWGSAWGDAWGVLDKGAYVLIGLPRNWRLLAVARDFLAIGLRQDFIIDEITQQSQIAATRRTYSLSAAPAMTGAYTVNATYRNAAIIAGARDYAMQAPARTLAVHSTSRNLQISAISRNYKVQP